MLRGRWHGCRCDSAAAARALARLPLGEGGGDGALAGRRRVLHLQIRHLCRGRAGQGQGHADGWPGWLGKRQPLFFKRRAQLTWSTGHAACRGGVDDSTCGWRRGGQHSAGQHSGADAGRHRAEGAGLRTRGLAADGSLQEDAGADAGRILPQQRLHARIGRGAQPGGRRGEQGQKAARGGPCSGQGPCHGTGKSRPVPSS